MKRNTPPKIDAEVKPSAKWIIEIINGANVALPPYIANAPAAIRDLRLVMSAEFLAVAMIAVTSDKSEYLETVDEILAEALKTCDHLSVMLQAIRTERTIKKGYTT